MSSNPTTPQTDGWLRPALLGVGLITLARVVLHLFSEADLFVDEAQYWLWGQDLAFGYYSKPPMIGWVIRLATEIGSDAPFWIRLPGPLFHAATSLILGTAAARLWGTRAGWITALSFVTLPMVAVGSLLISTDTIMFPFLATALLAYLRLLERPSAGYAVLCGAMLGLAFLSKYAAFYYLICAVLAAGLVPKARLPLGTVGLILLAFAVTISPNVIWNLLNGLTTVQHTLDNADWVRDPAARAGLNLSGLAEFFAAQFVVFGPVLMGALLWAAATWKRRAPTERALVLFALPIVLIVCVQALLSNAYANWAASAYLGGMLVAVSVLRMKPGLIGASFVINGAFCVILPLAATQAQSLRLGAEHLLLERYVGRTEVSQTLVDTAATEGLSVIVSDDRDVLADLFYHTRELPVQVFAVPPKGRAPHHYALKFPYQGGDDVLLVLRASRVPQCGEAIRIGELAPDSGAYRRHPMVLYRAPGICARF